MKRGKLIAFEGLDGCGKSTQLALLADALRAQGADLLTTREPTDGPHGRRIREMARSGERVAPETELEWFFADRDEHVREKLEPALAAGRIVLTDRYYLSTVAYQGARGLPWREILAESEARFPVPDLVVLVDVDAEQGIARVNARGGTAEPVFEELEFQRAVGRVFAELDCAYIQRIPGDDTPAAVHDRILAVVRERLGLAV